MKIYKNINVFDEALNRIERIYNEFENVVVSVSGGKDSTVIFNLALMVAKKLNRLPIKVMFIDQEAEWEATIDQIRNIMYRDDVEPYWYQMPIKLFNATSVTEHWLYCWEEGKEWMREKDEIAIKKNIYGEERFAKLFIKIPEVEYANEPVAYLTGMRTDECHMRLIGLTQGVTYKDITWGKVLNKKKNHYTFHPIYDWSYSDVWKAIFDNKWEYNEIYNKYYMDGVPFSKMRISNLHHEKSVYSLFYLQRYEPHTYEKLVKRLSGIDMASKFGEDQYFIRNLPFMFSDWKEYRDYLTENLLPEEYRESFRKKFAEIDEKIKYFINQNSKDKLYKAEIQSILTNDWEFVKLNDCLRRPDVTFCFKFLEGKRNWESLSEEDKKKVRREDFGKLQKTTS